MRRQSGGVALLCIALTSGWAFGAPVYPINCDSGDSMRVDGTVGIGLGGVYPVAGLHVRHNNGLRVENASSTGNYLDIYATDDSANITANNTLRVITAANCDIRLKPGNSEEGVDLGTDGDVGIGMDQGIGRVEIMGSDRTPCVLALRKGSGEQVNLEWREADASKWAFQKTSNNCFQLYTYNTSPTKAAVTWLWGGEMGVNTESPGSRFAVAGNTCIGSNYADDAAPQDGMIVEGSLGVGTNSPGQKLHVVGNAYVTGQLTVDTLLTTKYIQVSQSNLALGANVVVWGGEYSGIDMNGPLDVNGLVEADSANFDKICINDWTIEAPDYVFDNTYKLPSLRHVEKFVQENKHLPDVPSAKDMKQNGVDLAALNMALLKKVEELTLYAIAQQKEIEQLKSRVAKVK